MLAWIVAIVASLLVLAGGTWLGWLVLGRPREHTFGADLLVAAWVGWYLQGLTVLAIGWLGGLSPALLGLVVLVPLGALVLDRAALGRWLAGGARDYAHCFRASRWLLLPVAAGALWLALQLTAPPFHYDLLTYAFGQPAHWLAEGRIGPVGPDMYAYEAVPSRMHFLLALGLVGPEMAAVSLLLWVLAAAALTGRAIRALVDEPATWAVLGVFVLIVTPAIWDLLLLRKEDLATVWGGAAVLVLVLAASRTAADEPRRIVAPALAAAATFAAKPGVTAGYVGCALLLFWLADPRLRRGIALAAATFAGLAPLGLHAWLGLGNPLAVAMPYLSRYPIASTRWYQALADAYPFDPPPLRSVGDLGSFAGYALRELGRFYDLRRWNFGDDLGLLILLGLPLALLLHRRSRLVGLWLAGIAGWFLTFHWPRFTMVLLPLEVLLVVTAVRRFVPARVAWAVVALAGAAHAGFFGAATVTGVKVFRPAVSAALAGGADGRLPFVPPSVEICEQANAALSPETDRILFVGETRVWPCRIPFEFWNAHFRHPFERVEHGVPPEATWERYVAEHRITHVIYSREVALKRMEWSPALQQRFERWLAARSAGPPASAHDQESSTWLVTLTARP